MTFTEFDEFAETFLKEVRKMKDTKGKEYANTTDRFDNFNRLALKNDVERLVVANIYMTKHLDAIDSYIKTGREHSSEPIRGRFIDAVTYLILMAGMQSESKVITGVPLPASINLVRYIGNGTYAKYLDKTIVINTNDIFEVISTGSGGITRVKVTDFEWFLLDSELCHYKPKT